MSAILICQVKDCGARLTDVGTLCKTCTKELKRDLLDLSKLIPTLRSVASRERCIQVKTFTVHRTYQPSEHSLPWGEAASRSIRSAYHLAVWCGHAIAAGFTAPAFEDRRIVSLLSIAAERVDVLRMEPDGHQIAADAAETVRRARLSVDPESADLVVPERQREAVLDAFLEIRDAVRVVLALTEHPVSPATVYRWASEGKLLTREGDQGTPMRVMPRSIIKIRDGERAA